MSTAFEYLLVSMFIISLVVMISLFVLNAPYGRYLRKGYGPPVSSKLAWIIMETPAVVTIFLFYAFSDRVTHACSIVFLCIWQSHYLYRTFIYPFFQKGESKPMPIGICLMGAVFNVWNGTLIGYELFFNSIQKSTQWFGSAPFLIGVSVFSVGAMINKHSDYILTHLRKPGEKEYKIPFGGVFKWVSMPNYLGEIIQWIGFAILTMSLSGVAFAVFTVANLLPRAMSNHKWYKETFSNYPKSRKAIIPFVL